MYKLKNSEKNIHSQISLTWKVTKEIEVWDFPGVMIGKFVSPADIPHILQTATASDGKLT